MFESKINRGRANGYAPLDGSGKVPLDKLPPIQSTINTGSFATTGSNIFTGNQTISGSEDGSLTIGELNFLGGPSFGLRVSGSEGAPLVLTSDGTLLIGAIANATDLFGDTSVFSNSTNGFPTSDGPIAGISVQKSGSFQSAWLFDYDGKSYFPGDINIGYGIDGSGIVYSGSLNISKGNINVSGSLYFGSGSAISEASNSISITPSGAGAGQSLVIRPTLSTWATTASAFIVYGEPITVAIISVPNRDYNGNYFGTLNYEISGSGVTQQSLGRPLTGSFVFNPGNSEKSITWTIPANSTISEFTLTIVSLDGTYTGYESGETDPALYYNFEENGLPIGQYITVTNNGIFNSEHSHIHLVSGDPSTVDIYLGDDDQYVKIEKNAGDVVIGTDANNNHWRFGDDGSLTLPDGSPILFGGNNCRIQAAQAFSISSDGGIAVEVTDKQWLFGPDGEITTPGDIILSGSLLMSGSITLNGVTYTSLTGSGGTSGESGTSGIDGTSGESGTSGIDGTSGESGTSGVDGTSGTSANMILFNSFTSSVNSFTSSIRGEINGIEAYTASLKAVALISSSAQISALGFGVGGGDVTQLGVATASLNFSTGSINTFTGSVFRFYQTTASLHSTTSSLNTFTGSIRGEVNGLEAYTASLKAAAIVSSSTQITNFGTFATLSSNNFNGNQVISGSLTVSSTSISEASLFASSSNLVLNSGSNLYINNNGLASIGDRLQVSGSTILSGSTQITGSLLVTGSMTISSGSITMPNRPGVRVTGAGGGKVATTVLSGSYLNVDWQQSNAWNNSTGTFTAPIAGLYQVNVVVRTNSNTLGSISQLIVFKNNTSGTNGEVQIMVEFGNNTTMNHAGGSTISRLAVGDTLKMVVAAGEISFDTNDNFSVAYIG